MLIMLDKKILDEVVEAILAVPTMRENAVKIILYGSVARGDDTPESDVDIALITREKINFEVDDNLTGVMGDLLFKYNKLFAIIDLDEAFFKNWLDIVPFYMNIEREGIVLWKAA